MKASEDCSKNYVDAFELFLAPSGNETIIVNTFNVKPLEVITGSNQIKDADLPTYQETEALINKLEYERTHSLPRLSSVAMARRIWN